MPILLLNMDNWQWQLNANALYELPLGFDIGATLFARQGFAYPVQVTGRSGADGVSTVWAAETVDTASTRATAAMNNAPNPCRKSGVYGSSVNVMVTRSRTPVKGNGLPA